LFCIDKVKTESVQPGDRLAPQHASDIETVLKALWSVNWPSHLSPALTEVDGTGQKRRSRKTWCDDAKRGMKSFVLSREDSRFWNVKQLTHVHLENGRWTGVCECTVLYQWTVWTWVWAAV